MTEDFKQRAAWALVGLVVMSLILLGAVTIVRTTTAVELIREEQVANVERNKDTNRNTEIIESCTTPGGECYERSQRQTGEAVASITDFNLYLAVCEKRSTVFTVAEFKACAQELLDAGSR